MFLRKLQANVSNHAVTLLLIDWYQYHPLLLFAVSDRKSRVTHSAVRCYRIISSVSLLILRVLSHGQIIYFYFAEVSTRTSSYTASTWCVCGTQKVRGVQSSSGALKPLALKWKSEILTAFYQQTYTFDVMRLRDSKGSVNLLRINCVLLTSLHSQRGSIAPDGCQIIGQSTENQSVRSRKQVKEPATTYYMQSRQNAHRLKTTFGGNNSEIPSPQPSCRENKTVHWMSGFMCQCSLFHVYVHFFVFLILTIRLIWYRHSNFACTQ